MADIRHKLITDEELHNPKGFVSGVNSSVATRDELGKSRYEKQVILPQAQFVDGNNPPPSTVLNDTFVIFDGGGGVVDAGWNGASFNDWTRYDGATFQALTPTNQLVYDTTNSVYKNFNGSAWVEFGVSSPDTNIANTNLTLDANRTHDLNSNNLIFSNGSKVAFNSNGSLNSSFDVGYDGASNTIFSVSAFNNLVHSFYYGYEYFNDAGSARVLQYEATANFYYADFNEITLGGVRADKIGTANNSIIGRTAVKGIGTSSATTAFEIFDNDTTPRRWAEAKDDATLTLTRPSTATTGFLLNVDNSAAGAGTGGIFVDQGATDFGLQVDGDQNTVLRTSKSGGINVCSFGDTEGSYLVNVLNHGAAFGGSEFANFVAGSSGANYGQVILGYGTQYGLISGGDRPIKWRMTAANAHWFDNDGSINIGAGAQANGAALLELTSTTRGLLLPRMTAAQAGAITAVNGLVLYVTSTDATFTSAGVWAYEAGAWVKL